MLSVRFSSSVLGLYFWMIVSAGCGSFILHAAMRGVILLLYVAVISRDCVLRRWRQTEGRFLRHAVINNVLPFLFL